MVCAGRCRSGAHCPAAASARLLQLGRALHRSDIAAERDAAIFALNTAHSLSHWQQLTQSLVSRCCYAKSSLEAEHALRKAVKFTPARACRLP